MAGLFDSLGGGGLLDSYLTPEQKRAMGAQQLSGLAQGMLAASGPSRMPIPFGQVMAGGLQGQQAATDNSIKNLVLGSQLGGELQMKQAMAKMLNSYMDNGNVGGTGGTAPNGAASGTSPVISDINLGPFKLTNPQAAGQTTAKNKAADQVAQNNQDIMLANQLMTSYNKAIQPDPELGGKSPAELAPGGPEADNRAAYMGMAPSWMPGADPMASKAYSKLRAFVVPTAAAQAKENFQRVTGFEYGKGLESQGLNELPQNRTAVIQQNLDTIARKRDALVQQNKLLDPTGQLGNLPQSPAVNTNMSPPLPSQSPSGNSNLPPAPAPAIAYLKAHPEFAPQFEQKYGIPAASLLGGAGGSQ